jgi:hypothetical protein
VTQMVAANSEESASASEELSSQASVMQSLVEQFKLAHGPEPKRVTATTRRAAAASRPPSTAIKGVRKPNGKGQDPRPRAESLIPFDEDIQALQEF